MLPLAALIPIAVSLATKFAPQLIGRLAGEKAGEVAQKVIGVASAVTGLADPQVAHDTIMKDPSLQVEFEKAAMNLQVELYREDTKRLIAVNEQMGREAQSDKWYVAGWRPFNGFLFGITLFCDRFISQFIISFLNASILKAFAANPDKLAKVPDLIKWDYIDSTIYMMWTVVLGVSAGSRGFEKVKKAKAANGALQVTDALKTFAQGAIGR